MTTVGKASIDIEVDGAGISRSLEAAMDKALASVSRSADATFSRMERSASDAGSDIGSEMEAGARAAERALSRINVDGIDNLGRAAAAAADSVAKSSADAADSLSGVGSAGAEAGAVASGAISSSMADVSRVAATAGAQAAESLSGIGAQAAESGAVGSGAMANSMAEISASAASAFSSVSGSAADAAAGVAQSASSMSSSMSSALSDLETAGAGASVGLGAAGGKIGSLAKSVGPAAAGLAGLAGAGATINAGFGKLTSIEDTTASLGIILDDAAAASDLMAQLQEDNLTTPYMFDAYAAAGKTLAAFGADLEGIPDQVRALGEAAAASGGGQAVFDSMARASGQAMATGKMSLDTINQLAVGGVQGLQILANHFGVSTDEMQKMISAGLVPAQEGMDILTKGILEGSDGIAGATGAMSGVMQEMSETTSGSMTNLLAAFTNLAAAGIEPLVPTIQNIADSLTDFAYTVIDLINGDLPGWLSTTLDIARPLGVTLGVLATGLAAVALQQKIVAAGGLIKWLQTFGAVTKANTAIQAAFNVVMAANPIVLVTLAIAALVAGLAYFFTQTETGKRIWDSFMDVLRGAWDWLSGVFAGVWSTISEAASSAFEWISEAWSTVWGYLQSAWDSVGAPIFDGIKFAFGVIVAAIELWWEGVKLYWTLVANIIVWAWDTLIKPTFDALKVGLDALGAFFQWVWESVISPVWNALGAGIRWVYDTIIAPTWEALKFALSLVGEAFRFYWENVINPVWTALGAGIRFVYDTVIAPAWDALKAALGAVGDFFQWVWNSVISPVWNALGDGIRAVLDNVVHPAFEGLKTGLGFVRDAFQSAVDFIGQMWDRIKGITAAPIKFVIDTVYNNGIRAVWNKVAGWLGLDELGEMPMPRGLGDYARGGVLPGYTPGTDIYRFVEPRTGMHIGLSGGEAIMRPEFTRAVGGPEGVERLNRLAMSGKGLGFDGDLGGYAGGGVVESIISLVGQYFPGMSITSTYRNTNDHHGSGLAVDFSNGTDTTPQMQQAARFFHDNYGPGLLELIHWPLNGWQNLKNGVPLNYGEPTNSQHRNHVHVAAPAPLGPPGSPITPVDSGGGAGTSMIGSLVSSAFSAIMDPILDALPDFGGGLWGSLPGALIDKLVEGAKSFFGSKTPSGGANMTPGSGPVVDQVREAMAAYGWDKEPYWSAIDFIIGKESGWNPLATNPSSGAFGLPQFNPMGGNTLGQYLPDRNPNPRVQGDAMARYIRDRYGNPLAARDFWVANNWYDDGGVASGKGAMMKNTIKPERVLNPAQTEAFEAWMEAGQKFDEINDLVASVQAMQLDSPEVMADEIGRRVAEWIGEEQEPGSLRALAAALQTGIEWERVVDGMQRSAEAWANGEWVQIADDRRLATPEEMASQVGENFLEEIAGEFGGLIGLNNPYKARSIVDETGTIQLPQEASGIVPVTGEAPTVKADSGTTSAAAVDDGEGTKETINVQVEVNVNGVQDPVAVSDMVVERMGRGIEQAFGGTGRSL